MDVIFVNTRGDKSVSKEEYYTILGIKADGLKEILSIVNTQLKEHYCGNMN
ncbi:hypothetical protein [Flavobacterium sp. PL002]